MVKLVQKYQLGKGVRYQPSQVTTRQVSLGTSPYQFTDENGNLVNGYWFTDRTDHRPTLTVQDQNGAFRGVSPQIDGSYKTVGDVNFTPQYELTGNNGEELTVTPNGSSWQTPYSSAFHSEDALDFANAMTGGSFNSLSPSQWLRRLYDLKHLSNGTMSGKTYADRFLLGNEGVVSRQFAQNHPYLSTAANLVTDITTPGVVRNMASGLRSVGRDIYSTGNRILDEAAEGMRRTMYPEPVVVGTDGRTYAYNDIRSRIMQRAEDGSSSVPKTAEPEIAKPPTTEGTPIVTGETESPTLGETEPTANNKTSATTSEFKSKEDAKEAIKDAQRYLNENFNITWWNKLAHPHQSYRASKVKYPYNFTESMTRNLGHKMSRNLGAMYGNPLTTYTLGSFGYGLGNLIYNVFKPSQGSQQPSQSPRKMYIDSVPPEFVEQLLRDVDSIGRIQDQEKQQQQSNRYTDEEYDSLEARVFKMLEKDLGF